MKICCTNTQKTSLCFCLNYYLRFENDFPSTAGLKNQSQQSWAGANTSFPRFHLINPPLLAVITHKESFSFGRAIKLPALSDTHFICSTHWESRAAAQYTVWRVQSRYGWSCFHMWTPDNVRRSRSGKSQEVSPISPSFTVERSGPFKTMQP